uniref:Uncharacterized protein n=1 Tax=Panagrolaimus superbus TaxID=310955 RepID=A0A914YIF4_9BILA
MGAQSYPSGGRGAAWHHCAEYLAVYLDPENLLPGAGHWRVDGRDSGGSERFASEQRDDVYHPQATRRTQRNGAANYRPSARKTGERTGGESVPDGGTGYSRWWASVERQLPVHVVIRRPGGTARMGAENPQKTGDVAGTGGRELRSAG